MFFMEWSTEFCVDYGEKKEKHPKNQRKPRFWYNLGISITRDRPENTKLRHMEQQNTFKG